MTGLVVFVILVALVGWLFASIATGLLRKRRRPKRWLGLAFVSLALGLWLCERIDHPLFARGPFTGRRCERAPSGRLEQVFPAARGQLEVFDETTVQHRAVGGNVTWCVEVNESHGMDTIRQIHFHEVHPRIFGYSIHGTFETSNYLHHGLITLHLWPTGGLRGYWLETLRDDLP